MHRNYQEILKRIILVKRSNLLVSAYDINKNKHISNLLVEMSKLPFIGSILC